MQVETNTVRVECESGNVMVLEFGETQVIENEYRGTITEIAICTSLALALEWAVKEAC
jgi:hypothetical protein